MVYKGKSHLEMDDLGVPPFMETPIWIDLKMKTSMNHSESMPFQEGQ